MTVKVDLPKIEPSAYYAVPQIRNACGPFRTGTVTYDVDYGEFALWIYVAVAGNLAYQKWDGTTELLPNLAIGWHRIPSKRVNTTNTTITEANLRWGS